MAGGDREDSDSILSVIVRRNLEPSAHGETQERVSRALRHLYTVRLDREGITVLKSLELVKEARNLYLQENQIKKIENLDVLKNLRFLSLSWNRVEEIQNLRSLNSLQFLDISHNLIKKLDTSELPPRLLILDLTGNPCTKAKNYRQQVREALPLLQKLDGETVRDSASQNALSNDEEEEEDGSSSDDSEETDLPFDASGGFSSVSQEIIQRSYQRRHRVLREHEERLSELSDTPDKQLIITPRNDTANAVPEEGLSAPLQHVTSCTTKPQNCIHSEQHRSSTLVTKQLRDQQNNAKTKDPVPASSCRSGPDGLNSTSSKKLPRSAPQSKPDTVSTGKTPGTVTFPKDRPAISAPPTRKTLAVPNKNTLQPPMKTPAKPNPTTTAARPQHARQVTSAPAKKTAQPKEKLPMTQLKASASAQGARRKTS